MASRDRWPYLVFAGFVLVYLFLRAAYVPFVNDEARAFYMYVLSGSFLPFRATWDAANHPLLSALAQVSWRIGGTSPFTLRIWGVLAFAAYAWYAWRMGAWLKARLVRWCFWAAFLACPLLLDFFALFRGYGLAMGLLVVALFHAARFLREEHRRDLLLALVAITLAGWAMLSLIIVWTAVLLALAYTVLRSPNTAVRAGRLGWCVLLGALPLLIAAAFLWGLKSRELLYSGTDAGYLDGTVRSLSIFVLGTAQRAWRIAIALVVAAAAVLALWPSSAERSPREELARMAAFLLCADLLGHAFLFFTTHALFPIDRGALYLLPLSILLLTFVVDRLAGKRPLLTFAALPLLFLPLRSVVTANLDSTLIWGAEAIPERFHALVEARQRELGRPLVLGGHDGIREAWSFGAAAHGSRTIALDPLGFPQADCDLLLIDSVRTAPPAGFRTIATTSTGEFRLMECIAPLHMEDVLDTLVERNGGADEFIVLWRAPPDAWQGREAWVEVDAQFTGLAPNSGITLVADVSDTLQQHLAYHNIFVDRFHQADQGGIHLGIRVPRLPPSTGQAAVYLFNPGKTPITLNARIKVREILPEGGR